MPRRRLSESLPHPLAFVFSGGANLGAVQAGMLLALRDAGIAPDLVVGSSVGALNAGLVANHGLDQGAEILSEIWARVTRHDVFPGGVLSQAWCLFRTHMNLFPNDRLAELICNWLTVETFEELPIPLGVMATELVSQRGMLFNCGPLRPALLASAAIPGLYPPVAIDGVEYIDGGFTANVPLNAAMQLGARAIVVLDVGGSCMPDHRPRHIADMLLTVIQASLRKRVLVEAPAVAASVPVLYLPSPCMDHGQVLDFDSSVALMREAAEEAGAFLAACDVPEPGRMVGEPYFNLEDLICTMNGDLAPLESLSS